MVRQAAKETSKPVRLDIVGGSIEIDRGVLDRMTAAFEHLLRNSVVHGIESAEARAKAGKDATGTITLSVTQVGNEVGVEVRDDGAGLNLPRIRERGQAMGLIAPGAEVDDAALANLIFQPGFTTASSSAAQRVVLHVDEVLGNQEVVVKNLGPQLSRVPGLVGMTLLPSGLPALIYNPVALATLYGDEARQALSASAANTSAFDDAARLAAPLAPLVVVVDDSLTVRRITQRLLEREGYRVTVAKDGLDGLDKLAIEVPAVLLTDIEMPRMDGFDLVRNLRADARMARLPVVMITSRIAQKHRDYAAELGVDHYLGKPYAEDALLGLVARYARRALAAA
ncbi:MAG: hypothetical protein CFE45_23775 [Burkholderiales bacterium PBB5]|nr:MAG: hypothetical protein CFE45_23775 [Burkholderiales bacterium PBB5]